MNFCVKCGIDCEVVIDGLCTDCFLDGRTLSVLPHHVDLHKCANCGDFNLSEQWIQKDLQEAIEDAAIDALEIIKEGRIREVAAGASELDASNYSVTVEALLDVKGYETTTEATTIVRLKNTVCRRCSRYLGSYYESILQIRFCEKNPTVDQIFEVIGRVENYVAQHAKTNRELFISKIEQVPGGADIYLSSIQLGKALSKILSDAYFAETKEAAKLVGRTDDGQDLYRVTYLVRLPDYHVGDVVIIDNRYCLLTKVSGGGGKAIGLADLKERAIRYSDMGDIKVYEKAADIVQATVVSRSGGEIQVLHPRSYATLDLKIMPDAVIGDSVKVVDADGTLYYVPAFGKGE